MAFKTSGLNQQKQKKADPMLNSKRYSLYCAAMLIMATIQAQANVGTHMVGYGAKAISMGGASVALPQDSIAAANNPAGMAVVGNRLDLDIDMIYGEAELDFGSSKNEHDGSIFLVIPEFGINYQLLPNVTLGLSTFASGAFFKYDDPVLPIPGLKRAKGGFRQLDLLPTATYTFDNGVSLGLSFVYAIQQFSAQGLPGPFPGGQNPDYGTEKAYGTGWKAGGLWPINDQWTVGASYTPKIKMSELSGYKDDLLAPGGGSIDSPEQYTVGLSVKPLDRWTVALDYQHLAWDNVDVLHDIFGWRSQDVIKAGVAYELDDLWTLRGGVSHARLHTTSDYVASNFLIIGVNSTALTMGATRKVSQSGEINVAFEYDYGDAFDGTDQSEGSRIDADFYMLTVGYGWKF